MFKYTILLIFSIILLSTKNGNLYSQETLENIEVQKKNNFYEIQKSFDDYWSDKEIRRGTGWKQFKRWEQFWEQRVYPYGNFPQIEQLINIESYLFPKDKPKDLPLSLIAEWEEIGPNMIPINKLQYESSGMGRLNVIRIHPDNPNELWVGAAAGGLWRSTDAGNSWNVFDFTNFMSIGISDIAISPTNPDIIYVATGDYNGANVNPSIPNCYSIGLIKSTNAGKTWELSALKDNLNNNFLIARVLVHPENPNIVIVGTNNGIFKSTNGGNSWVSKYEWGFTRDLEFKPDDPNIIYAGSTSGSLSRFLKSTDLGETWNLIENYNGALRIEIAVTTANPDYVYSILSSTNYGFYGFYRSTDSGDNWTRMSNSPNILGIHQSGSQSGGQGHYDLAIVASPFDADDVYIGGIHIWRSKNGGKNWDLINHWTGSFGKPYVHADQHYLAIDKEFMRLYSANDGGLYVSEDMGTTWTDISTGLNITQFYKIGTSVTNPDYVIGGTQDNGTHILKGDTWYHIYGGDGMECHIDYTNENILYASVYYGRIHRSTNGGNSFSQNPIISQNVTGSSGDWVTPYLIDPNNPQTLYAGFRDIWKTTNSGGTWAKISNINANRPLSNIAVAPSNSDYIYFSYSSTVMRTTNGGQSWETLQSFPRAVSSLTVDDDDPTKLYIGMSGYSDGVKVYEAINNKITNISSNLPNVPVNTLAVQKNSNGTIFAGTDLGVFVKDGMSNSWIPFNDGMPPLIISDLHINYSNGKLYAGTFGRGIWKTSIIECNIEKPKLKIDGKLEFCVGESVTLSIDGDYSEILWTNGHTGKSITVETAGNYSVMVRNEKGCIAASETVEIKVYFAPELNIITSNDAKLCIGGLIELRAPFGFARYEWSTGDTTRRIEVDKPGTYSVIAYTVDGCTGSNQIEVYEVSEAEKPTILVDINNVMLSSQAKAYQWYLNDEFLLGENKRTLVPKKSGIYRVEITNDDGCKALSDGVEITSVSVKEFSELNEFKVLPNPSNDGIFTIVKPDNLNSLIIKVYDALGNKIYQEEINELSNSFILDLSSQAQGIYMLNITSDSYNQTIKLIKNVYK